MFFVKKVSDPFQLRLSNRSSFTPACRQAGSSNRSSFTLIELLIVLAIVAILSVVVVMTLNPAELLRQARDSNRLSDLNTINTALGAYTSDTTGGFTGTSSIVYVSIADTTSTCANLGLPTLPSGWSYNCVTSANLKKTDGTGWIPVNFQEISFGTPISSLPIDPVNTTSSRNYYTYVTGGSWQLGSVLESQKYQPQASLTNDYDPGLYIAGTNSSIAPFVGGLVGWWKFEEGSGTTSTDSSGYAKQNVWYGSGSHWSSSSKSGSYSGVFNGTDDYISAASTVLSTGGNTISFWILLNSSSANSFGQNIFWSTYAPSATPYLAFAEKSGRFYIYGQPSNAGLDIGHGMPGAWRDSGALATGSWHHVVSTQSPSQQVVYIDGVQTASRSFGTTGNDNGINFGKSYWGLPNQAYLDGSLDDIRVYNRALSAVEVSALYNATR